jgi:hypothetical protein
MPWLLPSSCSYSCRPATLTNNQANKPTKLLTKISRLKLTEQTNLYSVPGAPCASLARYWQWQFGCWKKSYIHQFTFANEYARWNPSLDLTQAGAMYTGLPFTHMQPLKRFVVRDSEPPRLLVCIVCDCNVWFAISWCFGATSPAQLFVM